MEIQAYREEIKLFLTGGLLEIELDDLTIDRIINSAFREIQRYIDITAIRTVPFQGCIDVKDWKINSVTNIYRAQVISTGETQQVSDPMYMAQWQLYTGYGNLYNTQDYTLNYTSWNTLQQIRNTVSTDLAFYYDKNKEKLYINSVQLPGNTPVTVEYVPRFDNVEEITSDYWIDVIMKLSIALTKTILGRIRSKYTQNNALWTLDGPTLLQEGNTELAAIREQLRIQSQLFYPID